MDTPFTGFGTESFAFFRDLAEHNNKIWFDQNRNRYDQFVVGAFRSLLVALEPGLLRLNPNFEMSGKTNRNFSRINRDIRFSKDKSPYKSNYYLYLFDGRRDRHTDGRFYVGLNAECLTVGFATYVSWGERPPSTLERIFRKRFAAHRETFHKLLEGVVRHGRFETYWHRQEKGEWALHPGLPRRDEEWQTLQGWIVRRVYPAESKSLAQPAFANRIAQVFRDLYPIYVFTSVDGPGWPGELRRALRLRSA